MIVKLLTEHHLEFLSLKGGCSGSSESTHVKMPHCSKAHATAQMSVTSKHTTSGHFLSVHKLNAIQMAFRWWADDGPRFMLAGSVSFSIPCVKLYE